MKTQDAKLLRLKSAARVLGVEPESLQSEADAGRVPYTKVGDEYLFALAAFKAALLARAQGGKVWCYKIPKWTRWTAGVVGAVGALLTAAVKVEQEWHMLVGESTKARPSSVPADPVAASTQSK